MKVICTSVGDAPYKLVERHEYEAYDIGCDYKIYLLGKFIGYFPKEWFNIIKEPQKEVNTFKIKITNGIKIPCNEVDPFYQCSIRDCMKCWNAKVEIERVDDDENDNINRRTV